MTDQTAPHAAVWIDGDPLMEAIASAVWEQCRTDYPSSVVDDPRNIAAVAAAAIRAHQAAGQAPATDQTAEVARLHDELLASKAEIAKLRALLGKENQRANDAITREETTEQAAEEAQQEARRLGLMVDEYGAGASALTDKLRRARDMHRETCPVAQGVILPPAASCSLCGVLDAPATAVLPAPADRPAVLREAAERLEARAAEFTAAARKDPLAFAKGATDARYRTADCWDAAAAELRHLAAASAVVVRRATDETPGEAAAAIASLVRVRTIAERAAYNVQRPAARLARRILAELPGQDACPPHCPCHPAGPAVGAQQPKEARS